MNVICIKSVLHLNQACLILLVRFIFYLFSWLVKSPFTQPLIQPLTTNKLKIVLQTLFVTLPEGQITMYISPEWQFV